MRDEKQVGCAGDSEWKGFRHGVADSGLDIVCDFLPDSFSLITMLIIGIVALLAWAVRFFGAE